MSIRATGLAVLAVGACFGAIAGPAPAGAAVSPRASLTDIESQVMCVTCGVPLSIAESPQAEQERAFIRGLIDRGETGAQIKRALVAELGPSVLALPERSGFNLAVYLVPVALIAILASTLAVALPRWRRSGAQRKPPDDQRTSIEEDARLDAELARFRD